MPHVHRDDPAPTDAALGRPSRRKLATVAAAVGGTVTLLVAVGAWLQPDLRGSICDLTERHAVGCNDVPDAFLGQWTGAERCHGDGLVFVCVDDEAPITLVVKRGRVDQKAVVTSRSEACESSWRLLSAEDNVLEFHTEESRPMPGPPMSNPDIPGAPTGCPTDLSATLRLDPGKRTLQSQMRSGDGTALGLAPGIVMFTASLDKN